MKRLLCACALISLQWMTAAHAYEADIHYSTTYVIARAVGWGPSDALTIASANQGMDENEDTVAALELDTKSSQSLASYISSSLHQAEKNLQFHCFSRTRVATGRIPADVLEVIADRFARIPRSGGDRRSNSTSLIALGTALHCQQDAYAHAGFGGSCGSYSGNCYGHAHQTFLDQVVFRVLKKHFFDPDHPGVSGARLLEALRGTASELAARRPKGSARAIPTVALTALYDHLRRSGLELPDEVRRRCNRYIAGQWLFGFFQSGSRTQDGGDSIQTIPPGVAVTCRNAALASTTIVSIPDPRFPRLNRDASPFLVRTDGTYLQVHESSTPTPR